MFLKVKNLFVNQNKSLINIVLEDIYVIEARADYIYIKTKKGNYIVKSSLKKVLGKLPSMLFVRVHKSFIINISKINQINQGVILIEGEHVPLSKMNTKILFDSINLL